MFAQRLKASKLNFPPNAEIYGKLFECIFMTHYFDTFPSHLSDLICDPDPTAIVGFYYEILLTTDHRPLQKMSFLLSRQAFHQGFKTQDAGEKIDARDLLALRFTYHSE